LNYFTSRITFNCVYKSQILEFFQTEQAVWVTLPISFWTSRKKRYFPHRQIQRASTLLNFQFLWPPP